MGTSERDRLDDILDLARQLAARLGPHTAADHAEDSLALRLAQAHALGLVDQLAEMVAVRATRPVAGATLPPALATRALHAFADDELALQSH